MTAILNIRSKNLKDLHKMKNKTNKKIETSLREANNLYQSKVYITLNYILKLSFRRNLL